MRKIFFVYILLGLYSCSGTASTLEKIHRDQVEYWNHIAAFPAQYHRVKSSPDLFYPRINETPEGTFINVSLVKKMANWEQQHSNGLKVLFSSSKVMTKSEENITYGDIKALSFQFSLDKNMSYIPSTKQLEQEYAEKIVAGLIKKQWFDELVTDYGVLNIKLFGEFHEDQAIETVMANYQLPIESSMLHSAQHINLPLTYFDFYQQKNWQKQPVSMHQIHKIKVLGMLITAETKNQKTLRNYMQATYTSDMKETYIELAVSFNNMALIFK